MKTTKQMMRKKRNKISDTPNMNSDEKGEGAECVLPSLISLEQELERVRLKSEFRSKLRSTTAILITIAAIAVLLATMVMPFLRIYGSSMTPTLEEDQIVVSLKTGKFQTGDVVAFYYNNKILVKRVIAKSGDWVDIKEDGTVYINGNKLEENYIDDKALGQCDIKMPYQVPDEKVFVMGDHRSTSVDSRTTLVGCVAQEQIVGKILFRIWPINEFKRINY